MNFLSLIFLKKQTRSTPIRTYLHKKCWDRSDVSKYPFPEYSIFFMTWMMLRVTLPLEVMLWKGWWEHIFDTCFLQSPPWFWQVFDRDSAIFDSRHYIFTFSAVHSYCQGSVKGWEWVLVQDGNYEGHRPGIQPCLWWCSIHVSSLGLTGHFFLFCFLHDSCKRAHPEDYFFWIDDYLHFWSKFIHAWFVFTIFCAKHFLLLLWFSSLFLPHLAHVFPEVSRILQQLW